LTDFIKIGLTINKNSIEINNIHNQTIKTNKDALNIILTNLISNANRFTQNGTIQLDYDFDPTTNSHIIYLKDTGKGMSAELIESINSQNLEILNRNAIEYQSYGIGYNLIFKMLSLINGKLTVENNLPNGTKIKFELKDLENQSDNNQILNLTHDGQ
jgi:hypothetical protein